MTKILLTILMLTMTLSAFAGDTMKLQGNEYTLILDNITRVTTVTFTDSDMLSVDGPATISELKGVVSIKGNREVSIVSIVFPAKKVFSVTSGGVFTFKDHFFTLTGRNEKQFIRFDKKGFFLQNDKTVVKIGEGSVSVVDDEGDRVEISKKGTVIKGEDEQVRLGILGKFISFVVRKAVFHNIDSQKIIADTLTLVAQEEEIDVDIVGGTFNVNIDNGNITFVNEDLKVDKTSYSQITEVNADVVSAQCVFKRSSDAKVSVEVTRPKNLPDGYHYTIDQDGGKLVISEKFTKTVRLEVPVVFTIYVPNNLKITGETVSGSMSASAIATQQIELYSVSGDITVDNVRSKKTSIYKTVSGNISASESDSGSSVVSSTSGQLLLKNLSLDTLSATVSSGDIRIEDTSCGTITVKITSGDAMLKKVTAKKLEYSSVSGDLFGEECVIDEFKGSSISGDGEFTGSTIKKKTFTSSSGSFDLSLLDDVEENTGS